MQKVDATAFVKNLNAGDIGIILGRNWFATMQNWLRSRFKEGDLRASHGFYLNNPPELTEANGFFISRDKIFKNIGDKTKVWIFRYDKTTKEMIDDMNVAADMAVKSGGHYSITGIFQFAKAFITKKIDFPDEGGVFCTEFTSDIILEAIPPSDYITDRQTWQIDPSYQLNWFMSDGKDHGWELAGHYDGEGNYFIS